MKIKTDFVTNSSSSAVLIFIPREFNLTFNDITKTEGYAEYLEMDEPSGSERHKTVKEVMKQFSILKDGQEIASGPYSWVSLILFEVLKNKDFVLKEIEVDGEGASTIHPVNINEIKEIFEKVNEKCGSNLIL